MSKKIKNKLKAIKFSSVDKVARRTLKAQKAFDDKVNQKPDVKRMHFTKGG